MKNRGITFFEVCWTIVIIVVLASLASVRYFTIIEVSRKVEALNAFGVIRPSMDRCFTNTGDYRACNSFSVLDIEDPEDTPWAHFDYVIVPLSVDSYHIQAMRNTYENGDPVNQIFIRVDEKEITQWGVGLYSG